jgi:nicotinate-nucleotide--dimethylbenzimidazole phosphoribosyltransferase
MRPPIAGAIAAVEPPDPAWADRAAARQARLTMPPGSLGRLLDLGRHLAAVQRTDRPHGAPALVAVFAADHGVAREGVSAYPQDVTGQMVANFLAGGAAINALARRAGAALEVVDLGVAGPASGAADRPGFRSRSIAPGTASFLDGPAMTEDQATAAFEVGWRLGRDWAGGAGYRAIALGEMGIGNTTSASALVAALTGADVGEVVGRGTGVDDAGLARKREVVARAVERHRAGSPDAWDWAVRVGGFEIVGLAGLALAAAAGRAVVVLDGLISTAAGLLAARLCPAAVGSMVAAHVGVEPGHRVALAALGLRPLLDLGLRLGEGSGAALALPLIAAAGDVLRDMATFESAGVSDATPADRGTGD